MTKEMNFKTIVLVTIIIVSGLVGMYGWNMVKENYISVPGTVVGKSCLQNNKTYCFGYCMTVKPDNSEYNDYDVSVDFTTFSGYKVGSHVTFKVMTPNVTDNNNYVFSVVLLVSGVLVCGVSVISLLVKLSE